MSVYTPTQDELKCMRKASRAIKKILRYGSKYEYTRDWNDAENELLACRERLGLLSQVNKGV